MRIDVDGITVYFPYEFVYPEQYAYMVDLKRTLDARGHSILEMPTGTGKTVTILSLILSYQLYRPELAKLVYCTRTVGEMDKVLHELRRVLAHRDNCYAEDAPARAAASRKTLAVGLTTRRNLCLHPAVSSASSREEADALCRSMTASWARGDPDDIEDVGGRAPRRGAAANGSVVRMADADGEEEEGAVRQPVTGAAAEEKGLCEYFEGYDAEGTDAILPAGVYGIDELMAFGKERGWCPYYTARHALSFANVIVYNYQYLLDPKVAGLISRDLARECVVVFDEVRLFPLVDLSVYCARASPRLQWLHHPVGVHINMSCLPVLLARHFANYSRALLFLQVHTALPLLRFLATFFFSCLRSAAYLLATPGS